MKDLILFEQYGRGLEVCGGNKYIARAVPWTGALRVWRANCSQESLEAAGETEASAIVQGVVKKSSSRAVSMGDQIERRLPKSKQCGTGFILFLSFELQP